MKTAGFRLSFLLAFAASCLPVTALAQRFQEPTKEELQMTVDAKAPGESAVYLYREESTNNQAHYISRYVRMKVLTEAGKEYATVEVPYNKGFSEMPIIEARTIHADGAVVPLVGRAEDLLVFKTRGTHVNAAVFNMPSVEVGSILEYKWTIPIGGSGKFGNALESQEGTLSSEMASTIPFWQVQISLFVHKSHFYFSPFTNLEQSDLGHRMIYYADGEQAHYLLYTTNLPAGTQVNKSPRGDYSLDVQDVPASPRESNAPPESSFLYHVRFYYTPYFDANLYWTNEINRWSKQVDSVATQSNSIKQAADQITAGASTPDVKARKLYEAVQELDNTDFTRAKTEEERHQLGLKKELKKAQDVLSEKSGSGNDMAELYLALARSAGLEAYGTKVVDRRHRVFDPNLLSLRQLDALLVVLRIDNKEVFLDPGQKLCPYGQLAWNHSLAGGLQQNMKSPIFTPANLSKDGITAHSADLTVDEHGAITGVIKILMNGPEALRWRQLNLTTDPSEVTKQFNELLHRLLPETVDAQLDQFQGMDGTDKTGKADALGGMLRATVKVHGQLGNSTGKRLILPAFFFSSAQDKQFVSEPARSIPIDLHYAEQVIDDVIYHLPSGYQVESAPQPAQLPWPAHAALVTKTIQAPGVIEIKHTFARTFVLLDSKEYPTLREYYQKLATNDQQQLVLTLAPSAVSN